MIKINTAWNFVGLKILVVCWYTMPVRSCAVWSERLTKMRTGEQNGTKWSEFVYQHEVKLYLYHEYSKAVWNRWFHVVMFTPCRNKKQSRKCSVFILYHIQIVFTPVLCIRNYKANPVLFHVVFNSYRRSVHGVTVGRENRWGWGGRLYVGSFRRELQLWVLLLCSSVNVLNICLWNRISRLLRDILK